MLVLELLATLQRASEASRKEQRIVARAFVDQDGPEIVYSMESCMNGNWIADAKNGTMKALSSIVCLPGPIGQAVSTYRRVAERNKLDAGKALCNHDN